MTSPGQRKSPALMVGRLLPDQFSFLLRDRPTLSFERHEDYDRLLASLIAQYDPKTVMDFLLVKDLADALWEAQRLRRMKTAAMAVEMEKSAWKLMSKTLDNVADELKLPKDKEGFREVVRASLLPQGYMRDKIRELQDYASVTDDMMLYEAYRMGHGTMSALDAALSRAERRRDQLARMLDDRARTAAAMNTLLPRQKANSIVDRGSGPEM